MAVTDKSFHHLQTDGRLLYFCGNKCKDRFARHLATYTSTDAPHTLPTGALQTRHPIQLRWWLLLLVGLMSLALVYHQLV
jgi:YHS domain-containing protein